MTDAGRTVEDGLVAPSVEEAPAPAAARSALALVADALTVSPIATIGAGLILFWALCAVLAPWISPFPPNAMDPMALVLSLIHI